MLHLKISGLNIYPLKSTAGQSLNTMTLDTMGPRWDRRWMIVDRNNRFLSQRQYPLMCKLHSQLTANGLLVSTATMDHLEIDCRSLKNVVTVSVWDDRVRVLDCGEQASQWFSRVIAPGCRLVYMPDSCHRPVDPHYTNADTSVSFADGFPLLLTAEASLEALNNRLPEHITMERFRPNIIVSGCEAFAEDQWQRLSIAGIEFSLVKPCSRCVIPSIDPATGLKQSKVLTALRNFRLRGNEVLFGQNVIHHGIGKLAVNDPVTVIA